MLRGGEGTRTMLYCRTTRFRAVILEDPDPNCRGGGGDCGGLGLKASFFHGVGVKKNEILV